MKYVGNTKEMSDTGFRKYLLQSHIGELEGSEIHRKYKGTKRRRILEAPTAKLIGELECSQIH